MVCRCACGGVRAGHIGSDHTRTRSRPVGNAPFGSQMGSKPVRLIKSSGLARMAHRTTNARAQRAFSSAQRTSTSSWGGALATERIRAGGGWPVPARLSGTVRPVLGASGLPRIDPLGVGHTLAAWHLLAGDLKTTVTTTAGWAGGWLARHKRLNRPSRGPCTRRGVSAGRAPVNRPLTAPLGRPDPARRTAWGRPATRCQTPRSTPAACTRSSTSRSPIAGRPVWPSRSTFSASP